MANNKIQDLKKIIEDRDDQIYQSRLKIEEHEEKIREQCTELESQKGTIQQLQQTVELAEIEKLEKKMAEIDKLDQIDKLEKTKLELEAANQAKD